MTAEQTDEKQLTEREKKIIQSLQSGIVPMEMYVRPIISTERNKPFAYRTSTVLNSITEGRLFPRDYVGKITRTRMSLNIAEWNIKTAMKYIKGLINSGKEVEFLTARIPVGTIDRVDLYEYIKKLIEEEEFPYPEKLCLEFTEKIFQSEKAAMSILDMKLLGVKTMLTGVGNNTCPVPMLTKVKFDSVLTDRKITALAGNRNTPDVFPSFVSYLSSMKTAVYADNVSNDKQRESVNHAGCMGYTLSPRYNGRIKYDRRYIKYEKELERQESEEDY